MSMVTRLKDLVRANLNDMMSKAEDPEKSLNLYIEDASEHLRAFAVEVNRSEANRILVEKLLHTCAATSADWHEKAKLAMQQSREDLARKALEQEGKEKTRLGHLQQELAGAEATSAQMKEQYQLLENKLDEAKERREDLIRRNRAAVAQRGAAEAIAGIGKEDPFFRIDRMEEKVEQREAEAQAAHSSLTASLSYEMEQLQKNQLQNHVDDALAKLKEEVNSESR